MDKVEELISAFCNSCFYNISRTELILVLKATLRRLRHEGYSRFVIENGDLNFIVDIFFGTLVSLYGDYGTSPRFGWIEDEVTEKNIVKALEEEIAYYEDLRLDEE